MCSSKPTPTPKPTLVYDAMQLPNETLVFGFGNDRPGLAGVEVEVGVGSGSGTGTWAMDVDRDREAE
jgi:hypothetical protein